MTSAYITPKPSAAMNAQNKTNLIKLGMVKVLVTLSTLRETMISSKTNDRMHRHAFAAKTGAAETGHLDLTRGDNYCARSLAHKSGHPPETG